MRDHLVNGTPLQPNNSDNNSLIGPLSTSSQGRGLYTLHEDGGRRLLYALYAIPPEVAPSMVNGCDNAVAALSQTGKQR